MRETAEQSKYYANLAAAVIEEHDEELGWIPKNASVGFLESDRPKKKDGKIILAECIKIRDLFRVYIPHDFVIAVYMPNVAGMTDEQLKILLYHEMLHIGMENGRKGPKLVVKPHDVEDFRAVLERYGFDWAEH